jgi:hypothetical protein
MVVNFRARGISRGARKLTRTSTLIEKKEEVKQIDKKLTKSNRIVITFITERGANKNYFFIKN